MIGPLPRRWVALFLPGETDYGTDIPPRLSLVSLVWITALPFMALLSAAHDRSDFLFWNLVLVAAAVANDLGNAWRWRRGWRDGRQDVVLEIHEAWRQGLDPREWLHREVYFGDPANAHAEVVRECPDERLD